MGGVRNSCVRLDADVLGDVDERKEGDPPAKPGAEPTVAYALNSNDALYAEARDLNIAESTRQDGPSRFAFQKLNSNQTKARATESLNRINKDVPEYVEKAYWSQAGMELRRQLNTMRFDINNLVDEKGGDRTQAKKFYQAVEALDFQIRSKDKDGATAAVATVQDLGNALLASLV